MNGFLFHPYPASLFAKFSFFLLYRLNRRAVNRYSGKMPGITLVMPGIFYAFKRSAATATTAIRHAAACRNHGYPPAGSAR